MVAPPGDSVTAHTFIDFPRFHIESVMYTTHCQFQLISQSSLLMWRLDWLLYSIITYVSLFHDPSISSEILSRELHEPKLVLFFTLKLVVIH